MINKPVIARDISPNNAGFAALRLGKCMHWSYNFVASKMKWHNILANVNASVFTS